MRTILVAALFAALFVPATGSTAGFEPVKGATSGRVVRWPLDAGTGLPVGGQAGAAFSSPATP